jgi:hypothetical protein
VRISWLQAEVVRAARDALRARSADWDVHFTPEFEVPPPPSGWDEPGWEQITEHVARAERVSQVVRSTGLAAARERFGASSHAVELAIVIAAAQESGEVDFELIDALFACAPDELIFYGPFLEMLIELGRNDQPRALALYTRFCGACMAKDTVLARWPDRVRAVRDGLASYYVSCGMLDDAEALYAIRHREDSGDVAVALGASRSFLAAGAVARAVHWLGLGAERAGALGRNELAQTLSEKQARLRGRLS